MASETLTPPPASRTGDAPAPRLDGVVIGVLVGFADDASPLVAFAGNSREEGVPARSTTRLEADDVGREVALMFEEGDPARPLVMGRLLHPEAEVDAPAAAAVSAQVDGERIEFRAEREIVLRCGRASITLTRAGKILIKGAYLLSRSSGVNRIKGGSVQIN